MLLDRVFRALITKAGCWALTINGCSLWSAGGWPAIQNAIGAGKYVVSHGLPESPEFKDGRWILRVSDVTDPETVGDIIALPKDATPVDEAHEMRHADQSDVLGPAMVVAKPVEAVMGYGRGPLERDAFRATEPTTEFLRKPGGAYSRLMEALLRQAIDSTQSK